MSGTFTFPTASTAASALASAPSGCVEVASIVEAARQRVAAGADASPRVFVWEGEPCFNCGHKARYINEPVVRTLVGGIEAYQRNVSTRGGTGARVPTCQVARSVRTYDLGALLKVEGGVRPGDLVIWVSIIASKLRIAQLRRITYLVNYQTEPIDHSWCRGFSYCALDADELWDFAWHNVDHFAACGCKKLYATSSSSRAVNDTSSTATPAFASATTTSTTSSTTDSVSASATTPASSYPTRRDLESPPKLRYLPLGVLTPSPTAHHARKPPPLTFFGLMDKRNSSDTRAPKARYQFWKQLNEELPSDRMQHIYSVWSDEAFGKLIGSEAHRPSSIFLNLHKGCGVAHNPVTFRVQKLLSAKALVLSESAYAKDMEEFEGLVDFYPLEMHQHTRLPRAKVDRVDFDQTQVATIADAYRALAGLGPKEREALAEKRYAAFARRFAPARIFERAGVFELFDRKLGNGS